MLKRLGKQTIHFETPPVISGFASVAGKREADGPLGKTFTYTSEDISFGEKTWEKSEMRMQKDVLDKALQNAKLTVDDLDFLFSGDLLNQCVAASFGLRETNAPFLGIYGACSTMAEGLILAAMMIDGRFAKNTAAVASSHFCTAERQYRFPLEYGGQRPPTAQWTVTGAGAAILSENGSGMKITHAITGKIVDKGIKDANNMGGAMAPAAYETLKTLFAETNTKPTDYDMIATGDLGDIGKDILIRLFHRDGVNIQPVYDDCGCLIYDLEDEDIKSGGSGCGCSASVLCGHLLTQNYKKLIFAGTGALLSTTTALQGESIPGICHAVILERT